MGPQTLPSEFNLPGSAFAPLGHSPDPPSNGPGPGGISAGAPGAHFSREEAATGPGVGQKPRRQGSPEPSVSCAKPRVLRPPMAGPALDRGRFVASSRPPPPRGPPLRSPVRPARDCSQCLPTAARTRDGGPPCVSGFQGQRLFGRIPIRPVLKHGPRSLTCARVSGLYEIQRRNESEGPPCGGPGLIPGSSGPGRKTGPSHRRRPGGGARAHTLGPERW